MPYSRVAIGYPYTQEEYERMSSNVKTTKSRRCNHDGCGNNTRSTSGYCHNHNPGLRQCGARCSNGNQCRIKPRSGGKCHLHAKYILDADEQIVVNKRKSAQ